MHSKEEKKKKKRKQTFPEENKSRSHISQAPFPGEIAANELRDARRRGSKQTKQLKAARRIRSCTADSVLSLSGGKLRHRRLVKYYLLGFCFFF